MTRSNNIAYMATFGELPCIEMDKYINTNNLACLYQMRALRIYPDSDASFLPKRRDIWTRRSSARNAGAYL